MEDSILGLDAASVLGKKPNHGKHDIRILDNKIILISKEALFELVRTGWFWEPKPSDEQINKMVMDIEQDRKIYLGPRDTRYCRPCSKKDIISGLEKAMNGTWTYRENYEYTTPGHLKRCFESFLNMEDFTSGKAELLMKVILCGGIGNIRELTENGVKEVEYERVRQSSEEQRHEAAKSNRPTPKNNSANSISGFFRKKIELLKYSLKNEWNPKFVGGRLVVTQHGSKYRVVAYSTTDGDTITVWDKSEAVVKSASWEGCTIVLYCGFGIIHLWGPNNNDY